MASPEGQSHTPSFRGIGGNSGLPQDAPFLRHIGIYAYRAGFLRTYGQLAPAAIERVEALEQLRALFHGYRIGVVMAGEAPPGGVDTEQDLHATRQVFAATIKPQENEK